jgi:hypothetical protein
MKVKELIELLAKEHPDAEVIVADNGSMLKTGSVALTVDYNFDNDQDTGEFFIVTEEWQ